jgi:hypothetical protein
MYQEQPNRPDPGIEPTELDENWVAWGHGDTRTRSRARRHAARNVIITLLVLVVLGAVACWCLGII